MRLNANCDMNYRCVCTECYRVAHTAWRENYTGPLIQKGRFTATSIYRHLQTFSHDLYIIKVSIFKFLLISRIKKSPNAFIYTIIPYPHATHCYDLCRFVREVSLTVC